MNAQRSVSASQFQTYLETFHRVYRSKLEEPLFGKHRGALWRWQALQNAKIAGYVSTTYGIGYEYLPADTQTIEVAFGSRRIEAHLFKCSPKDLDRGGNVGVDLSGSDFKMVTCAFKGAIPVRLLGNEASATVVDVTWMFKDKSHRIAYAEMAVNRSVENWSKEKAVERAMEEVLRASVGAMAMERLQMSLGDYLEHFKKGHVLVLGDFGDDGKVRLRRIKDLLGRLGYYGFTLDEVREVPSYDLRQKVAVVAPVCRFVVVDDSSRGGQAAELPIIEMLRATMIVLRRIGSEATFVTRGLSATSKVIGEYDYDDASLEDVLLKSVGWAETTIGDLEDQLSRAFPWRSTSS